jgi:hypothetical protein
MWDKLTSTSLCRGKEIRKESARRNEQCDYCCSRQGRGEDFWIILRRLLDERARGEDFWISLEDLWIIASIKRLKT